MTGKYKNLYGSMFFICHLRFRLQSFYNFLREKRLKAFILGTICFLISVNLFSSETTKRRTFTNGNFYIYGPGDETIMFVDQWNSKKNGLF